MLNIISKTANIYSDALIEFSQSAGFNVVLKDLEKVQNILKKNIKIRVLQDKFDKVEIVN